MSSLEQTASVFVVSRSGVVRHMERNPVSFLKRAKECRQLARFLKTPVQRLTLLSMAESWEQLARQNGIPPQRVPSPPEVPAWPKNE